MEIALFPINIAPDIVSNTVLLLTWPLWDTAVFDSNVAPAVWILTPLLGPRIGIEDAWHGYPFWNPAMLRESRSH